MTRAGSVLVGVLALAPACAAFGVGTTPGTSDIDGGSSEGGSVDAGRTEDGGLDEGDAALGAPCDGRVDCARLVFVTGAQFDGGLANLAGADAKCDAAARASSIPAVAARTFVAWLSIDAKAVRDRMVHGTKPYLRVDGVVVAKSFADLTDGTLDNAITRDENETERMDQLVWTGSGPAGNSATPDCNDWGSAGATGGKSGKTSATDADWTSLVNTTCDVPARLYCFER